MADPNFNPYVNPSKYNDPANGVESSVGEQLQEFKWNKRALTEAKKREVFMPLSETTYQPKHFGKQIKRYHYLPILHDANLTDQGIDANGATTTKQVTIKINAPAQAENGENIYETMYAVGEGATAAAALAAAKIQAEDIFRNEQLFDTDYATTKANLEALVEPWEIIDTLAEVPVGGNLYGSSKDIGRIQQKLPHVGEEGGWVNRVGSTRIVLSGTFEKFGLHEQYTADSHNFDSDSELQMHQRTELLKAATQLQEDMLQIDLLNSAGVVRYGGAAMAKNEISGETGSITEISYEGLQRLAIDLANNNTPKQTKMVTGTRLIDTMTVDGAYIAYIGTELESQTRNMVDNFGERAFVPARQYAAGTRLIPGEIGSIGQFRFVVNNEMKMYAGKGADATANNAGYRTTGGKYDVAPLLVVGADSFITISFAISKGKSKFKMHHVVPGSTESYAVDPYGEKGYTSLKWHYGFMLLRPERLAVYLTAVKW